MFWFNKGIPCASAPCFNNGTCSNNGSSSFSCSCPGGFRGVRCEIKDTHKPSSSNPSSSGGSLGIIVGIMLVFVVVIAIVIVTCLFYRRKRGKGNSPDIGNIQNTAYEGDKPRSMELQKIPDSESCYEEPAVYAQLANSLRVPVDENYQSLLNVQNYEQPDKDYVNLNVQGNPSMSMDTNPKHEVPGESEYEIMA
ncbi:c-binding -like [Paramuricea clavata]|uniref:C-binding -like n=1 Tax=Paramuricea clavata TaxID=317549 RepID=A0A7D9EBX6_PARCT|nr:c-binding -like [Paramuricea clavata]